MTRKIGVKKKTAKKKTAKKTAKKKPAKKAAAKKKPTIAQRIAKAKRQAEKARNYVASAGEGLFREAVRDVFKKFKNLDRFSWPQYTPHWNDGDECVFGVYFDSLAVNDEVEGDDPESLWTLEHAHELLSNRKKAEERILRELKEETERWKVDSLNRDLETLKTRDPKEVAEKYKLKKAITELLQDIDDSAYERMFGEGLVTISRNGGANVSGYEHD